MNMNYELSAKLFIGALYPRQKVTLLWLHSQVSV